MLKQFYLTICHSGSSFWYMMHTQMPFSPLIKSSPFESFVKSYGCLGASTFQVPFNGASQSFATSAHFQKATQKWEFQPENKTKDHNVTSGSILGLGYFGVQEKKKPTKRASGTRRTLRSKNFLPSAEMKAPDEVISGGSQVKALSRKDKESKLKDIEDSSKIIASFGHQSTSSEGSTKLSENLERFQSKKLLDENETSTSQEASKPFDDVSHSNKISTKFPKNFSKKRPTKRVPKPTESLSKGKFILESTKFEDLGVLAGDDITNFQEEPLEEISEEIFMIGRVERIRFKDPETFFTVAVVQQTGGSNCPETLPAIREMPDFSSNYFKTKSLAVGKHIVLGELGDLTVGQRCKFFGSWRYNEKYNGFQFLASYHEEEEFESEEDLIKFLGGGLVSGVGPVTAKLMVQKYGQNIISILDGENAETRLKTISGIGKLKAALIAKGWREKRGIRRDIHFFISRGVPKAIANKIVNMSKPGAPKVVSADPWKAGERIHGWSLSQIDKFAQKVGASPELPSRVEFVFRDTLTRCCYKEGHSFLPWNYLLSESRKYLTVAGWVKEPPLEKLEDALKSLEDKCKFVLENENRTSEGNFDGNMRVYLRRLYDAEVMVANDLMERASTPILYNDLERVQNWIQSAEQKSEKQLSEEQRKAVTYAAFAPIFVLSGGPGCGKTHTTRTIVKLWLAMGKKVHLCAPTGRAAQNLGVACGKEAQTIHRLLKYKRTPKITQSKEEDTEEEDVIPRSNFHFNEANHLETDAVVVDEASMLELSLAAALLSAIPPNALVLFVGDVDQLPPVGPGQVLKDIINSSRVEVFHLKEVFRQARESSIILSAHSVNRGLFPQLEAPKLLHGKGEKWWNDVKTDCIWIESSSMADKEGQIPILKHLEEVITMAIPSLGFDATNDVQVLSPIKTTDLGTVALNKMFQAIINPRCPTKKELQVHDVIFRVGDRVIQLKNNYDLEIFNGDLGTVSEVNVADREVIVNFNSQDVEEPRFIALSNENLNDLGMAWAITVHKSQGSEYPVVILPMYSHFIVSRKLVYTALTRAKKLAIMIGPKGAIENAIAMVRDDNKFSHLSHRITSGNDSA